MFKELAPRSRITQPSLHLCYRGRELFQSSINIGSTNLVVRLQDSDQIRIRGITHNGTVIFTVES